MTFLYRGPLPPHHPLFRGRSAELEKLHRICLGHEQTYATLYGGRQTGKTSLLMQLAATLPAHITPCRVDFQALPNATTTEAFGFMAQTLHDYLPQLPAPAAHYDPVAFRRYLQTAVQQLGPHARLLLMLEELGALPIPTRHDLANVIRAIFTNRHTPPYRPLDQLTVILAGNIELYELAVVDVSPLQNVCEPLYLGDLGKVAGRALVVDGLTASGCPPLAAESLGLAVAAQVDSHPYLTQRLAAEVLLHLKAGAAEVDVAALATQLIATDPFFQYLHKALHEHRLLPEVAPLLNAQLRFSRADAPLARLELLGVAAEHQGHWATRNPLIAQALQAWQAAAPEPPTTAPNINSALTANAEHGGVAITGNVQGNVIIHNQTPGTAPAPEN